MSTNLEKIKEVLYVLSKDQMTPRQLELATRLLTKTIQEIANKQLEISENTKKAIAEVLSSVSEQNKATGGQIEASVGSLTGEIDALKAQNQEVLDKALATLEKVNSIKVKDGKDADEKVIVEKVLKLIKIPEPVIIKGNEFDELSVIQKILTQIKMPEPFVLTGEAVVNEINKLPVTEEKQIDAAHIKNLPEVIGRGGGFGIREAPKDGKTYGRKDRDWTEVVISETDPLSIHLDQTTPQTVINGQPIFSVGIVSPEIKTNTATPTDLNIDCGTDKTLVLGETVYDDIIIQAANLRPSGTTPPTFTIFQDSIYAVQFTNAQTDIVYGSFEIPHTYKEGTDLEVHLHWSPDSTNTGNVVFNFAYTIATMNGTFGAEATKTFTQAGSGTINKHQYISNNTNISGGSIGIGTIVVFALSRPTGDAFSGNAFLHSVGVHYQIDTMGSRGITTK